MNNKLYAKRKTLVDKNNLKQILIYLGYSRDEEDRGNPNNSLIKKIESKFKTLTSWTIFHKQPIFTDFHSEYGETMIINACKDKFKNNPNITLTNILKPNGEVFGSDKFAQIFTKELEHKLQDIL